MRKKKKKRVFLLLFFPSFPLMLLKVFHDEFLLSPHWANRHLSLQHSNVLFSFLNQSIDFGWVCLVHILVESVLDSSVDIFANVIAGVFGSQVEELSVESENWFGHVFFFFFFFLRFFLFLFFFPFDKQTFSFCKWKNNDVIEWMNHWFHFVCQIFFFHSFGKKSLGLWRMSLVSVSIQLFWDFIFFFFFCNQDQDGIVIKVFSFESFHSFTFFFLFHSLIFHLDSSFFFFFFSFLSHWFFLDWGWWIGSWIWIWFEFEVWI